MAETASSGDGRLRALLEASGVRYQPDEVRGIIRAVLAAPEGHQPDAWLDLIAPPTRGEVPGPLGTT